tara:strand:- start:917 stop:1357 length:441 start_codon:yes stop_codon:yes gene_type:complete
MTFLKKLKHWIGKKPHSIGLNEDNLIGRRNMGLDPKWQDVKSIAQEDIHSLIESEKSYGDSWRRRGGTGAFMMLARKFDRIEQQSKDCNYDIFEAGSKFNGEDGLLDDIGDLRRYLLLVEHHIRYGSNELIEEKVRDVETDTVDSA